MVYVGIDVHRKRSQVAILDDTGNELLNRNVENTSGMLKDILDDLDPGTPVAFEAAYGWGWLADLLQDLDLDGHLAHPSACKAIASARLKNDKVDARMLAHLLRTNLLPEAWIAPRDVRNLRGLLRHRASLVRVRTSLKNRIHAVLADEGLKAEGEKLWSEAGQEWLAAVAPRSPTCTERSWTTAAASSTRSPSRSLVSKPRFARPPKTIRGWRRSRRSPASGPSPR